MQVISIQGDKKHKKWLSYHFISLLVQSNTLRRGATVRASSAIYNEWIHDFCAISFAFL